MYYFFPFFVNDNRIYFKVNSEIHIINTRINRIHICQYLIRQYIRRENITLELRCSTVCLLK